MSNEAFNTFKTKLLNNVEKQATNDATTPLIRLNTQYGPAIYFEKDTFQNKLFKYIDEKLYNDDLYTDVYNNCQVLNALNVIYLDGDFVFNNMYDFEKISYNFANDYLNKWGELLDSMNKHYYYFLFTPEEFPSNKGGFHIFIFLSTNISNDDVINLYNEVKNKFDISEYTKLFTETNYSKILDIGPIKTRQVLIPFAQKKGGRRYKLTSPTEGEHIWNTDVNFMFNASIHPLYETQGYENDIKIDPDGGEETNISQEDLEGIDKELMNRSLENLRYSYGTTNAVVFEFMESLVYLCDNHKFWYLLSNNETRLKYIQTPLIKYLYFNYFASTGCIFDNKQLADLVVKLLQPLLLKTIKKGDVTERATYKSIYNHAMTYILTYANVTKMILPDNPNYEIFAGLKELNLYIYYTRFVLRHEDKKGDQAKKYNVETGNFDIEISENDDGKYGNTKTLTLAEFKSRCKQQMHIVSTNILNSWITFVRDIIMDGLTREIEPFNDKGRLENICMDEVTKESLSTIDEENILKSLSKNIYQITLSKWCKMFMFISFYENKATLTEAIRCVITSLIKYYICCKTDTTTENGYNLIYNVRQMKQLYGYSYNQWLEDKNFSLLREWILFIYDQYIQPLLQQTSLNGFGLDALFKPLFTTCENISPFMLTRLKPLDKIGTQLDVLKTNTTSTVENTKNLSISILRPAECPYFPMRNGILKWLKNANGEFTGEYIFNTDNHDIYIPATTSVIWDDEYDKQCKEYKEVETMISRIYPNKKCMEYILKIFSSVLYGNTPGTKNQIMIMYGTGSDGKTTIINFLMAMLGDASIVNGIPYKENNKDILLYSIKGLSSTIKSEILLTENTSCHDEGGKVNLKNVRICNAQEPNMTISNGNLNGSIIKDILGGSPIQARGIYKASEPITPNTFITLQTNQMLGTNDTTEGMRRRTIVCKHKSKFQTEDDESGYANLKHHYKADTVLADNTLHNPKYWQALFYLLLDYAQDTLKNKWFALSEIPKPMCIQKAITDMYDNNTNGLLGWISSHLYTTDDNEKSILRLNILCKYIIKCDSKNIDDKFLVNKSYATKRKEIEHQLLCRFMGCFYKLRSEFIIENSKKNRTKKFTFGKERIELSDSECKNNKEFKQKYLEDSALVNLSSSNMRNKEDIYLVGVMLVNSDDPEIQGDYDEYLDLDNQII